MPSLRFVYGRPGDFSEFTSLMQIDIRAADRLAERTIFGFACERTRGAWIHACDTTRDYIGTVYIISGYNSAVQCCDVILLCIVSQISNKYDAAIHPRGNGQRNYGYCWPRYSPTKIWSPLSTDGRLRGQTSRRMNCDSQIALSFDRSFVILLRNLTTIE